MENTSVIAAIIASVGGLITALASTYISNAIVKAKQQREDSTAFAAKRLEGGWSGLVEDLQNWSDHVEQELRDCRSREETLKAQYNNCLSRCDELQKQLRDNNS